MIELLKSILLGIIQGLTEFLPISSSGHLVLAEHFLKFQQPNIVFKVILHLGSLFAVLIYFRKEIISILKSLIYFRLKDIENRNNRKVALYIAITTLVTGVIGFFFKDFLEKTFNMIYIPSVLLLVTGLILMLSDKIEAKQNNSYQLGVKNSIFIGLVQTFAILPGISRSGTTIAAGIFSGLKREAAARYSFLISIPAILGANLLKIPEIVNLQSDLIINYLAGSISAFISGYIVIALLIRMVKKQKLKYFSYYCWLIGISTIILYVI